MKTLRISILFCVWMPVVAFCATSVATIPVNSEWNLLGLNPEQQHFSPISQINEKNVSKLGLAWSVDMPTKDGATGVPLIADGVVYQSGALGKVFANDVRTGKLLWKFDAQIQFPLGLVSSWGSRLTRGLALWEDKVITATGDCRLFALDRKTGEKIWEAQACNPNDPVEPKTITGAPRVGGGKVFIGNSNADTGIGRGFVNAFDANTGKRLWRFYTIPGDPAKGFENKAMEMASKTWGQEYWKSIGGGSVWDAMTYDPKLNLLYFGVDGPSPFNPEMRAKGHGDELFTNSIVAVNADTGEYVWHYQTTPNDGWNYAATMHIMIVELKIHNHNHRVLMTAPKNGFFYVLDAKTGKLMSAENIVPVNWASRIDMKTGRPVELPDAKYWLKGDKGAVVSPSPMGAHSWQPMSYSPLTGLVYIPTMEMPALIRKVGVENSIGAVEIDFYYSLNNKSTFKGSLLAWDPIKQKERWRKDVGLPYNGGILSTAGNLVFQGTSNGDFVAYSADSGEKVWSMFTGSGIYAAPSTVEIDGEQLIIVPVGSGTTSAVGFAPKLGGNPGGPARLLAFKLNGTAKIDYAANTAPPQTSLDTIPKPPLPLADANFVERGKKVWDANSCELCHGFKVIGAAGSVPDLRKASKETHEQFAGIVLGGLRKDKGMPLFYESINMEDLNALQAYVISEAWKAYDAGHEVTIKR